MVSVPLSAQPFSGTPFVASDIVRPSDFSAFDTITYEGEQGITAFDVRIGSRNFFTAYRFKVTFTDGLDCNVFVNKELAYDEALSWVEKTAPGVGQVPKTFRENLLSYVIMGGEGRFSASGSTGINMHTGNIQQYLDSGHFEEVLIHEFTHISLDRSHANSIGWIFAQEMDNAFISNYARDNQTTEDVAESFLLYYALRYAKNRITDELVATIETTMPNRINYFDSLNLDIAPLPDINATITSPIPERALTSSDVTFTWTQPAGATGFYLNVGTRGKGSRNIFRSGLVYGSSVTVRNLPLDVEELYVRIWTQREELVPKDYVYTVSSENAEPALPVSEDTYRLKNGWVGLYLNGGGTGPGSNASSAPLNLDWGSQQWDIEHVYDNVYRLKTNWGGYYLTAASRVWATPSTEPFNADSSAQLWEITQVEGNTYRLKGVSGGHYLNGSDTYWQATNMAPFDASWGSLVWAFEPVAQ